MKGEKIVKILVVEDNKDLAGILKEHFLEEDFSVEIAKTGQECLEMAKRNDYACVIIETVLSDMDGLEAITTLREKNNHVPIIILSERESVDDKIKGLHKGADDYMTKPFDFGELVARVNAVIRRSTNQSRSVLQCGSLELDPVARECRASGEPVTLRRREFDILELLLKNENQVFTREQIINKVWKKEYDGTSNVVDVHVKYLRDRLRPWDMDRYVVTVRGVGYKVHCPER
jgi:two-component system copper resistance phosphate regulon response regulator CusR